jgi:hypothetical protein
MPEFLELTNEDVGSPWLREVGEKPTWTIKQATELLTLPGDDQVLAYNQLKMWAGRDGLLHPVRPEPLKRTSPALFDAVTIGAAAVLRELRALGLSFERNSSVVDPNADSIIGKAAALACYSFSPPINPRPPYLPDIPPIIAAMVATLPKSRPAAWAFQLSCYVSDKTRARQLHAMVFDMDHPPQPSRWLGPEYLLHGKVNLLLVRVLAPLADKIFRANPHGR